MSIILTSILTIHPTRPSSAFVSRFTLSLAVLFWSFTLIFQIGLLPSTPAESSLGMEAVHHNYLSSNLTSVPQLAEGRGEDEAEGSVSRESRPTRAPCAPCARAIVVTLGVLALASLRPRGPSRTSALYQQLPYLPLSLPHLQHLPTAS